VDIAPSDYHLFPELKKHLGWTHFRTGEELKEEVLSYLRDAARRGGRVLRFRHKEDVTPHAKMH
jgi:hypothetical protein